MRGALALALTVGCAPAAEPEAPLPEPETRTWRRTGSTADGLPPAGTAEAQRACARPCTVEAWEALEASPAQAPLLLVQDTDKLWVHGRRGVWRTHWRGLAGSLALCLGDPLSTPPAGDPGAYRLLHAQGDAWRWSIHLSGANPCGLAGQLELDAQHDRIHVHDLVVEGTPWGAGGREAAAPIARSLARSAAEARWGTADEAERARILAALARDPEAVGLVEELRRRP